MNQATPVSSVRRKRSARQAVMVGDGESETGPLSTSWHSNKFLNPITDGAVLPVRVFISWAFSARA
jgi:phosphoketolase